MVKHIIIITVILILSAWMMILSSKRDKVNNVKWDNCIDRYKTEGIPTSAYESFMRPCMDN